ncbi:hypothetical protein MMC14_009851 [Varicellaria rhodocarpa]|nr:hypothetical protein [Varicellaria rhodocarpa]
MHTLMVRSAASQPCVTLDSLHREFTSQLTSPLHNTSTIILAHRSIKTPSTTAMQPSVPVLVPRYVSPKRKRECFDNDSIASLPSPLRLRTDLPSRSFDPDLFGDGSPRTEVASKFSALDIQQESPIPKIDFGKKIRTKADTGTVLPADKADSIPGGLLTGRVKKTSPEPSSSLNISEASTLPQTQTTTSQSKLLILPPALEIPETPHPHPASPMRLKSPPPLHLTTTATTIAPRRAKSPPPPSPTSFSPDSSPEDFTGINGIGFRPTPAQSYARAQRRKQQVAEWKSREAKEARQRRSERRAGVEKKERAGMEREEGVRRKVRFVEG